MTSDPDVVLKSFGETSETRFLLFYTMQLFIGIESDKTHCAYDIPESDVFRLCASPARLPEHVRNFILWQRNVLQLDDGEILDTELPRGLKKKYAVKAARLAETQSKDERETLINEFIDEQNDYFERFNEVLAILEATEDRFITVEDTLLRAESLDDGVARAMSDQKDELDNMRQELIELRAQLEDPSLPDLIKFDSTPAKARELMKHLSEVNLQAREAIRQYQLAQDALG